MQTGEEIISLLKTAEKESDTDYVCLIKQKQKFAHQRAEGWLEKIEKWNKM